MENETATAASLADFWPQVLLIALVAAAIGALIGIQIAKKQKLLVKNFIYQWNIPLWSPPALSQYALSFSDI